jgi:arginine/lysine/ornithine decarboxylase
VNGDNVLLITSIADTDDAIDALCDAILAIDKELRLVRKEASNCYSDTLKIFADCQQVMPLCEATHLDGEFVGLEDVERRICREYVFAYPPGIPLLLPGQVISSSAATYIMAHANELHSTYGHLPTHIKVVKE